VHFGGTSRSAAGGHCDLHMQANISDTDGVPVHPYCATYSRTPIASILGAEDGGKALQGKTVVVGGWVKSGREQGGGAFAFIQLNDGSIFTDLQVCDSRTFSKLTAILEGAGASRCSQCTPCGDAFPRDTRV
jgi:hypothetical protein